MHLARASAEKGEPPNHSRECRFSGYDPSAGLFSGCHSTRRRGRGSDFRANRRLIDVQPLALMLRNDGTQSSSIEMRNVGSTVACAGKGRKDTSIS
jgi:hypothetical protein